MLPIAGWFALFGYSFSMTLSSRVDSSSDKWVQDQATSAGSTTVQDQWIFSAPSDQMDMTGFPPAFYGKPVIRFKAVSRDRFCANASFELAPVWFRRGTYHPASAG